MGEVLSEQAQLVKDQVQALIKLQDLDNEIMQRQQKITDLNQLIVKEDDALTQQREIVANLKKETETLMKDRRDAEVSAKQKQSDVVKLGGQLFEVKTNEAYNTLQSEIKEKKQNQALLEERILEMMVAEDENNAKIKQAEADLVQQGEEVKVKQKEHQVKITELEKEIKTYQSQGEEAAKVVKLEYLAHYRKLAISKQGKALAKIENNVCTGCQLSIRPQATIELRKYRALLYCNNCARILYVE